MFTTILIWVTVTLHDPSVTSYFVCGDWSTLNERSIRLLVPIVHMTHDDTRSTMRQVQRLETFQQRKNGWINDLCS